MRFITLVVFLLLTVQPALSCEPCAKILDLKESLAQADLVIIGSQIAASPYDPVKDGEPGGPEKVTIKIERVLKGQKPGETLEARSWYAMCDYGFVLSPGRHLLILAKDPDVYRAVSHGCAQKTLELDGEALILDDGSKISVNDFKEKFLAIAK